MDLPKPKTSASLAFTCMIDIFAITLLVFASKDQPFRDSLPLVVRESKSTVATDELKPTLVELSAEGEWRLDRERLAVESILDRLKAAPSEQKILVAIESDSNGRGALNDFLQFANTAQQHGLSNRLYVLTKGKKDSAEQKSENSQSDLK